MGSEGNQAVRIEGDRIVAVGAAAEIGRDGSIIDLKGRLAVPGLIDNHTHFIDGGFELSRVQLRDAATPQEFARRIGEYVKKIGPGKWIIGGEWDHTLWNPPNLPTRQLIDAVTPDNPVFVSRLDGHMALANSLALKMAKVTRDTPDMTGGTIVRDSKGEPTGVLKDAAQSLVDRVTPSASTDERIAAARAGLAEAARNGVTAFVDMSGGEAYDDLRAYQQLHADSDVQAAGRGVRRESVRQRSPPNRRPERLRRRIAWLGDRRILAALLRRSEKSRIDDGRDDRWPHESRGDGRRCAQPAGSDSCDRRSRE